ncbi:MAG: hypothetical protein ACOZCL_06730 [Bacillota bacterium]
MNPFLTNGEQNSTSSLNRVLFESKLPFIPEFYHGRLSGELIGRRAFEKLIVEMMPSEALNRDICKTLNTLDKNHPLIKEIGNRIGMLFCILKTGAKFNLKRDDWNEEHWNYWSRINRVILGGGQLSGVSGDWIIAHANNYVDKVIKRDELVIEKHNDPSKAVLLGLEYNAKEDGNHLLMDFGHTNYKVRICGKKAGKAIYIMDTTRPVALQQNQMVTDFLIAAARGLIYEAAEKISDAHISLAVYLKDGIPINNTSMYSNKEGSVIDVAALLSAELGIPVKLYHDGTAAADPFRNMENTVVVTIGTAIGVGYI